MASKKRKAKNPAQKSKAKPKGFGRPTAASLAEMLAFGMRYHQMDCLDQAEALYQQILQQAPQNADALHLLGLVQHQRGDREAAIARYRQAIALDPKLAEARIHLGHARREAGKWAEAIACYREALRLKPTLADVYVNLGNCLFLQSDWAEAESCYRNAILLDPMLADAHYNFGNLLQSRGDLEGASVYYRRVLALAPDSIEARSNLAVILKDRGELDDAIAYLQAALAIAPAHPGLHNNLGNAYHMHGDFDLAERHYQTSLRLNPDAVETQNNLGNLYFDLRQLDAAIAHHQTACNLDPTRPESHVNLGMSLLAAGEWARGWPEHEWSAILTAGTKPRRFAQPRWDGTDLAGKTILLYAEQGFGDALQFARYTELVQARGGKVRVECRPPLVRLFAAMPSVERVIAQGEPLPDFDTDARLLSLPRLLGTTLDNLPARVPYLSPPAGCPALPPPAPNACKVGLVWAGNLLHTHSPHRRRDCPLENFRPLWQVPNVAFYSLQKGSRVADLAAQPEGVAICDLSDRLHDFADTAGAIAQLDLVIAVDTAVAHLAGALAKPVWLLLPYASEWRWLLDRTDSPWYPTMRLFRQPQPGDWTSAIAAVTRELAIFAARKIGN